MLSTNTQQTTLKLVFFQLYCVSIALLGEFLQRCWRFPYFLEIETVPWRRMWEILDNSVRKSNALQILFCGPGGYELN